MNNLKSTIKKVSYTIVIIFLICLIGLSLVAVFVPSAVLFDSETQQQLVYDATESDKPEDSNIGLYIYDAAGNAVSVTDSSASNLYDENAAIVVYIHGAVAEDGDNDFLYVSEWQTAGYNVLSYDWSAFAVGSEAEIATTIWAETLTGISYQTSSGSAICAETTYSLADFFISEYIAFLNSVDITGAFEIRFVSVDVGGDFAAKLVTEIMELAEYDSSFNPILIDRVAFLDTVPTSSTSEILTAVEEMSDFGVAMEAYVNVYYKNIETNETMYDFASHMTLVEFKSDWQGLEDYSGEMSRWYSESLLCDLFVDQSITNSGEYSPSAALASSYILARQDVVYAMEQNTVETTGEESFMSVDVALPVIAGFTFYDTNGDGIYNERIGARAGNVKIELYTYIAGMTSLLGSYMTDSRGFYSIEISSLYANKYDNLYVVAYTDSGLSLTKRADDIFMMSNDVNSTVNKSDYFILEHRKNVQIVNVGVVFDEE